MNRTYRFLAVTTLAAVVGLILLFGGFVAEASAVPTLYVIYMLGEGIGFLIEHG